jgi:hypothetical protein
VSANRNISMIVAATIQNGQVVVKTPVLLPDGLEVTVRIETSEPSPLVWLGEHAIESGITDLAEQHDHYASGAPKRPAMKDVTRHIETKEDNPLLRLGAHAVETGVTDFSEQLDHYIYGAPKRE